MEQTNPQEKEFDYAVNLDEVQDDAEVQDNESTTDESTPTETLEKFKVKYNGQEMELTKDEIITNAQKGLNYDHVLSERDALKANKDALNILRELAEEKGIDPNEFAKSLKEAKQTEKLNTRIKELQDEGLDEAHAKRMAELEFKQDVVKPKEEKVDDQVETLTLEFKTLHSEFPETKDFKELSDFPQEVVDLIKLGKSPLVAYSKYQVDKIKKESETNLTNTVNKLKDTGSLSSVEDNKPKDLMLEAFKNS